MNQWRWAGCLLAALLVVAGAKANLAADDPIGGLRPDVVGDIEPLRDALAGGIEVVRDPVTERVMILRPGPESLPPSARGVKIGSAAADVAASRITAYQFIEKNKSVLGLQDPAGQLVATTSEADDLGLTHVYFSQQHQGVPVLGGGMAVHVNREGAVYLATSDIADRLPASVVPTISAQQAAVIAWKEASASGSAADDPNAAALQLMIVPLGMIKQDPEAPSVLTWDVHVFGEDVDDDVSGHYYVDAVSGAIAFFQSDVERLDRRVYDCTPIGSCGGCALDCYDATYNYYFGRSESAPVRGPSPNTSLYGGALALSDVDHAHDILGAVHAYVQSAYGINGANNQGGTSVDTPSQTIVNTHYQGSICPNGAQAWVATGVMDFCPGMATPDCVGHEYAHNIERWATRARSVYLTYAYQSGAWMEGYSDYMGEVIENYYTGTTDWKSGTGSTWTVLYDLADPDQAGYHTTSGGPVIPYPRRWYSSGVYCGSSYDNGGVHVNGSIISHMLYLLATGGVEGCGIVHGIGIEPVSQIMYRAYRYYFPANATFNSGYNLVLQAASDLYDPSICAEVTAAMRAVEIDQPGICSGQPNMGCSTACLPDTLYQTRGMGRPRDMVAADFNGDGRLDLATADGALDLTGSFTVLMDYETDGAGAGQFAHVNSTPMGAGKYASGIATGDLNGDGILDLAVAHKNASAISIVFGTGAGGVGDGGFGTPTQYALDERPQRMLAWDCNADGALDIVAAGDSSLAVLIGNTVNGLPSGTFATPAKYTYNGQYNGAGMWGLAVGDFNADDVSDIAAGIWGHILIFLGGSVGGVPDGTFTPAGSYLGNGYFMTVGDFDADGITDIAAAQYGVTVLLGNGSAGRGDGTFRVEQSIWALENSYWQPVIMDWNGDGIADLATNALRYSPYVWEGQTAMPGVPNGWFQRTSGMASADSVGYASCAADLDGDGVAELAMGVINYYRPTGVDIAKSACTSSLPMTLQVTEPQSGTQCVPGQHKTIRWTKGAGIVAVDVAVSRDGGAHWQTIAKTCMGDSVRWVAAGPLTDQARIRVFDPAVPSHSAVNDGDFVIGSYAVGVPEAPPYIYALRANVPNPFNPVTQIAFEVPVAGRVALKVFDVSGRHVRTLVDETKLPSRYVVAWDGTDGSGRRLASGLYFCRMEAGSFRETIRMTLLK